ANRCELLRVSVLHCITDTCGYDFRKRTRLCPVTKIGPWYRAMDDTPADAVRVKPCSIILVHGTWARGFFPKRREVSLYPPNKRWWFEEGSQFRAGLDVALKRASLDWQIRAFLWSGANSVHARDDAARELAGQLRKDLDDPNGTAFIIAHSHGGNVALRALQHLD